MEIVLIIFATGIHLSGQRFIEKRTFKRITASIEENNRIN
jgi:hypothetical protein